MTEFATLDQALVAALLARPRDSKHTRVWELMADLKLELSPLLNAATEEPAAAACGVIGACHTTTPLAADDEDLFHGIPSFIGSPPEEADLIGITEDADLIGITSNRMTSVDDLLSNSLGTSFDLFAPVLLVATVGAPDVTDATSVPPQPFVAAEDDDEELAEVEVWAEKNINLRALLSTLDEVIPKAWGWEATALSALIEDAAVLDAYRRAALAVHPDRLQARRRSATEIARGQAVFTALRRAQVAFRRTQRS